MCMHVYMRIAMIDPVKWGTPPITYHFITSLLLSWATIVKLGLPLLYMGYALS